jgi:hypothetical protein
MSSALFIKLNKIKITYEIYACVGLFVERFLTAPINLKFWMAASLQTILI